jgi:multidrug efflux pump
MASAVRDAARAPVRPHRGDHGDDVRELPRRQHDLAASSTSRGDINGAARDVQGAIAGRARPAPANLPNSPTYRKVNPADAPIMILALTSTSRRKGRMYDIASTVLQQKIAQLDGVGQIFVGGSSLPAVRVEVNPMALARYGIGLDELRQALASTTSIRPKGQLDDGSPDVGDQRDRSSSRRRSSTSRSSWRRTARRYGSRTSPRCARTSRTCARAPSRTARRPSCSSSNRQPGVNIIETVDRIRAELPYLRALLPGEVTLTPVLDQTVTIRASVKDVEESLLIAIGLVVLVVFLFLRNVRATDHSRRGRARVLIGTFSVMYLVGYSIDNLSLHGAHRRRPASWSTTRSSSSRTSMRHLERGMGGARGTLLGARRSDSPCSP